MNPLHNPYYTPLCKMDEVYGEGTVKRLKAADGPWEFSMSGGGSFGKTEDPNWTPYYVYRLAPAIPMTVPWDAIAEGWDWAAADADGAALIYKNEPDASKSLWVDGTGGRYIDHLVGFDRGTVDWRDSLQRRPGK